MSTAVKVKIEDILKGRFEEVLLNGLRLFRLKNGKTTSRVRVMGFVIRSMVSDDGSHARLILDDGTGSIEVRCWQESVQQVLDKDGTPYKPGTILDVIGRVRQYEKDRYITPKLIIKVENPNWFLVRELEYLNEAVNLKNMVPSRIPKKAESVGMKTIDLKGKIHVYILKAFPDEVTLAEIKEEFPNIDEERIENILSRLEEEGLIYRIGKDKFKAA